MANEETPSIDWNNLTKWKVFLHKSYTDRDNKPERFVITGVVRMEGDVKSVFYRAVTSVGPAKTTPEDFINNVFGSWELEGEGNV